MTVPALAENQRVRGNRSKVSRGLNVLGGTLALLLATGQAVAQEASRVLSETATTVTVEPGGAVPEIRHRPTNSDVLTYWYGSSYRTLFVLKPGTGQATDIQRNAIELSHAAFWSLGSTFANVMVSKSSIAEPAGGGGTGATEVYVTLRSNLGLNELTRSSRFRQGPLRNVAIEVGANLETKNSSFAPAERTIYFGPNFQFVVPRGYFNVGLHMRKEWNHEGVLGKSENYHPDFNIEPTWMFPFTLGKVHLAYSGFAEYNTEKGNDSFGSKSAAEFLLRNVVSVDVGAMLFGRAEFVDLTGGFWYWHNEYGKPSSAPGAEQMTPTIGLAFHLDGGRATHRR
jgi:hypothetical protein